VGAGSRSASTDMTRATVMSRGRIQSAASPGGVLVAAAIERLVHDRLDVETDSRFQLSEGIPDSGAHA